MAISFCGVNTYAKDSVKAYEFYKGIGFSVKEVDDIPANGEPIGEYSFMPIDTKAPGRAYCTGSAGV